MAVAVRDQAEAETWKALVRRRDQRMDLLAIVGAHHRVDIAAGLRPCLGDECAPAFGVGFEFPILLIFLQMVGVLRWQQLWGATRYAIVGICVLVAVITPSGDPISMLMLSVPMVVFYEVSILVGWLLARRKASQPAPA